MRYVSLPHKQTMLTFIFLHSHATSLTTLSSAAGGRVLLDIQSPVSDTSIKFMDKMRSRRRRGVASSQGEDSDSGAREDLTQARAVLKAIGWIQHVLSTGTWGALQSHLFSMNYN